MKTLLTSDWHEMPFAEKKFQSQKWSIGELAIRLLGGVGKEGVMRRMIAVTRSLGISLVIHNGDLQENTKNEQGIILEDDLSSAEKIISRFETESGATLILNAGNHELGYHKTAQPLATDPEGGSSLCSILNFFKLTEARGLYRSLVHENHLLVFIPYLLTEQFGKDFDINDEKNKILSGLEYDLKSGKQIILFIHDPDSLMDEKLTELLREHKQKISLIFCGHYHADFTKLVNKVLINIFSWKPLLPLLVVTRMILNILFSNKVSSNVEKYYKKRTKIPALLTEFGVRIIPAPGGMMGFGGGFLILDLETLEIKKYR